MRGAKWKNGLLKSALLGICLGALVVAFQRGCRGGSDPYLDDGIGGAFAFLLAFTSFCLLCALQYVKMLVRTDVKISEPGGVATMLVFAYLASLSIIVFVVQEPIQNSFWIFWAPDERYFQSDWITPDGPEYHP